MEPTLVRTGYTPWKALRSGPSHRQRQTVSLCEQLNVHACAADRLSILPFTALSPQLGRCGGQACPARDGITILLHYQLEYIYYKQ
jgi:hypothetical protein